VDAVAATGVEQGPRACAKLGGNPFEGALVEGLEILVEIFRLPLLVDFGLAKEGFGLKCSLIAHVVSLEDGSRVWYSAGVESMHVPGNRTLHGWAEKAHFTVKAFPGRDTRSALPTAHAGQKRPEALALGLRDGVVMRLESAFALALLVGCDQGPPPFDELPLRDALHASPEVVALLPDSARVQLAARFDSARARDDTTDELETSEAAAPVAMVAALDRVRQGRKGEPLVVGVLNHGAAWPIRERVYPPHAPALPPIEGTPAATTAGR